MSYMTISSQENHHFSLCSYFHAHPTTLLLKILGGTNAWAVPPPQIFGGPSPQSPLGLRPCLLQKWLKRSLGLLSRWNPRRAYPLLLLLLLLPNRTTTATFTTADDVIAHHHDERICTDNGSNK